MIKKIAILTSGGDAPGMNNVIRATAKHAIAVGIEPFLVIGGFKGLHEGNIIKSTEIKLDDYISAGGTVIKSSRFPEFKNIEIRKEAKEQLDKRGIDALVVVGGDGSYMGAQLLHELGIKTIALPGTIDNDISSTDITIGYDTALNTIVDVVEKIRDTMSSHNRVAVIEVMGHGCGDLALFSGLATGAEIVITNEYKKTPDEIAEIIIEQMTTKAKESVIVIVSEFIFKDLKLLQEELTEKSGQTVRAISLGHIQRGGRPSATERINASLMGIEAIDLLNNGKSGVAIGIIEGKIVSTEILKALNAPRTNRTKIAKKINKLNQA
ncbi:MAG: 6-phosphofructokinase [Mycoplasmataceae bacterium]|nr:6-phosphofructokinase [Mycoplasmataceae bacterium]